MGWKGLCNIGCQLKHCREFIGSDLLLLLERLPSSNIQLLLQLVVAVNVFCELVSILIELIKLKCGDFFMLLTHFLLSGIQNSFDCFFSSLGKSETILGHDPAAMPSYSGSFCI